MYIIDHDKQIALISEMKQLRKNNQKYEVYYHHPYTNQMWKSFFPKSDGEYLGPKLLRHEPVTSDISERLSICLAERVPENAIGLGIEWSAKPRLWPDIIRVLEKEYSHYDRSQIKLFLDNLELDESKDNAIVEAANKPSREKLDNLVWRSKKIRMKRFFVLG
ncbi:MAG TPA: hypothetical protein VJ964_09310 [Balneolaceae bacterium]|nr:hypothetical protein [Balneolaceae bacterium]